MLARNVLCSARHASTLEETLTQTSAMAGTRCGRSAASVWPVFGDFLGDRVGRRRLLGCPFYPICIRRNERFSLLWMGIVVATVMCAVVASASALHGHAPMAYADLVPPFALGLYAARGRLCPPCQRCAHATRRLTKWRPNEAPRHLSATTIDAGVVRSDATRDSGRAGR